MHGLNAGAIHWLSMSRPSVGGGFSPLGLGSGPDFWYAAARSAYAGGTWADLSGKGNDATQPSASLRPVLTTDAAGRAVMRFDGADDYLAVATAPDMSDIALAVDERGLTLFFAMRVRAATAFEGICSAAATGGTDHETFWTLQQGTGGTAMRFHGQSLAADTIDLSNAQDGGVRIGVITLKEQTGSVEYRDQDAAPGDPSTTKTWGVADLLYLGCRIASGAAASYGAVDVMEIGAYGRIFTATERDALQAYLEARHILGVVADAVFADGDVTGPDWAFSRPSAAMTRDHEGVHRHCQAGELRHLGMRRVENLFTDSDNPATQAIATVVGARYALYFRDGGGSGSYALTGAATATVAEGEALSFTAATTTLTATLSGTPGGSATVQLEETSGASVDAPGEYVSTTTIGPDDNAKVVGVRYLTTENGNGFTAPGPGTVTEATGAEIAEATREGALLEPAETNVVLRSRDLTQSPWTLAGVTATFDQVGINGRVDQASLLTDPGSGYLSVRILSQAFTIGVHTLYMIVKKDDDESRFPELQASPSALAAVQVNTKTGATATRGSPIAFGSIDLGDWWLVWVKLNATATSGLVQIFPAVADAAAGLGGLSSAASGSIIVGHVGLSTAPTPSSPIMTAGTTVTRTADSLTVPFRAAPWTLFQDGQPQTEVEVAGHALVGYASGSDAARILRGTSAYDGELDDGTDNPSASVLDSANGYGMGERLKAALSTIDGDEALLAVNGESDSGTSAGTVDTSGFATVGIGMLQTGGPDLPITVRQAQLLSIAKTAGEIEEMTGPPF